MSEIQPRQVTYCGVCSWPPEFCEFGISQQKCQQWLESSHPDLYSLLYGDAHLASKTSSLSIDQNNKIQQDIAKKQAKEQLKQEKELAKKKSSKITIKRIERNKRKHIISISGLEVFQIDSKKLAKTFASKFATGASVVKNAEKLDEILVQGDVSDEARAYIEQLLKDQQGLEDVKVEQIDEKKKKKTAEATATGGGGGGGGNDR
ncbi:TMA22 [Candida oxycetoniae]|uniref:Translation machinery-associated protein 22 n=1 Tax=Candida oxycetoniae TaxID=497107 RepID=A0AAI9SVC9_9ASCO|nr:TMA22 [Candida oxycetoniae]KAI3403389.2 TMA22 [Candida oxycetoniae]